MSFNDLPDELLLIIVGKLDYYNIKKCMRVSKRLNTITQDRSFNRKLFRERDVVSAGGDFNVADVKIHPLVQNTSCTNSDPKHCYLYTEGDCENWKNVTEYAATRKEYATSPPMNQIRFKILHWPSTGIKRKDGGGVTVLDLIGAICRFFDMDDIYGVTLKEACGWLWVADLTGDGPDPDFEPPKNRVAKHVEVLGMRDGWTGG